MNPLRLLTSSAQVAEHLRRELLYGFWADRVTGVQRLARELGVGKDVVEAAMRILEQEELLLVQDTAVGGWWPPESARGIAACGSLFF